MPATATQNEWYQANLIRERTKRREHARWLRDNRPEKILWSGAKDRARRLGIPFDIEVSDIVIPDLCPILKQPLARGTRYAPSLDRFRPELGYVKGNVWIISRTANLMKNDASLEELMEFKNWLNELKI